MHVHSYLPYVFSNRLSTFLGLIVAFLVLPALSYAEDEMELGAPGVCATDVVNLQRHLDRGGTLDTAPKETWGRVLHSMVTPDGRVVVAVEIQEKNKDNQFVPKIKAGIILDPACPTFVFVDPTGKVDPTFKSGWIYTFAPTELFIPAQYSKTPKPVEPIAPGTQLPLPLPDPSIGSGDGLGGPMSTPRLTPEQMRLAVQSTTKKARGEQLVIWDECNKNLGISGIRSQAKACVSNSEIAKSLADTMSRHFGACTAFALKKAGTTDVFERINIRFSSLRRLPGNPESISNPGSLHIRARAIDIKSVEVTRPNQSPLTMDYDRAALGVKLDRSFYIAFRECWAARIRPDITCDLSGSIGWEDRDHRDHLHLSLPDCRAGRM